MKILIDIDDSILNDIKNTYGNNKYGTVKTVVTDTLMKYANIDHFDPELEIDTVDNESLDTYIENQIRDTISLLLENNGYDDKLLDATLFEEKLIQNKLNIPEYEIARIYALAEIYYKITNHQTKYGCIVELICSYDVA